MKIREHEHLARQALVQARVDSPGLCGRLLCQHVARLDRISYLLAGEQELAPDQAATLAELIARRSQGEPLAYIVGKKEFFSRDFEVSAATLVPRPETELLVETALALLPESALIFAEAGCGSGCIGLTLLCERPAWAGLLFDISPDALAIARKNSARLNCKADFLLADMALPPFAPATLDLVISNPPYIPRSESHEVMPETLAWEPHLALFSEADGLAHLRAVIDGASFSLKPGGHIIIEHGYRQRDAASAMLRKAGFVRIQALSDLAGLPRCLTARKEEERIWQN